MGHGSFNVASHAFFRRSFLHEFKPRFIKAARKEADNSNNNKQTNKVKDNRDGVLTLIRKVYTATEIKGIFRKEYFLTQNALSHCT